MRRVSWKAHRWLERRATIKFARILRLDDAPTAAVVNAKILTCPVYITSKRPQSKWYVSFGTTLMMRRTTDLTAVKYVLQSRVSDLPSACWDVKTRHSSLHDYVADSPLISKWFRIQYRHPSRWGSYSMAKRVRRETRWLADWNIKQNDSWIAFLQKKRSDIVLAKCANRQHSIEETRCPSKASRVWRHQRLGWLVSTSTECVCKRFPWTDPGQYGSAAKTRSCDMWNCYCLIWMVNCSNFLWIRNICRRHRHLVRLYRFALNVTRPADPRMSDDKSEQWETLQTSGISDSLPTALQGAGTEVTLRNDVDWIVVSLGYLSVKRERVSLERRDVDDVFLEDLRVETSFRQRNVTGTSVATQESTYDTWRRFSGRRINQDVDEGCPQFCYCFGSGRDVREKKQRRVSSSSLVRVSLSRRVLQSSSAWSLFRSWRLRSKQMTTDTQFVNTDNEWIVVVISSSRRRHDKRFVFL